MKRILVFGAGGFAGSAFCELVSGLADYELFSVYHKPVSKANSFCADIRDSSSVSNIIAESLPDAIINLAGMNSLVECDSVPDQAIDINLKGSVNILEEARKHTPQAKILLLGSSEVYDYSDQPLTEESPLKPRNIYGYTKLWQEQAGKWYQQRYGMNVVCTRSFNHIGVAQSEKAAASTFCMQAAEIACGLSEPVIHTGNLDVVRDMLDVRDVASAYLAILNTEKTDGIYNVCSAKGVNLNDMLHTIARFVDMRIDIVTDPERVRSIDLPFVLGDQTRLKRDTGWEPQYSLEDTLREMFQSKVAFLQDG